MIDATDRRRTYCQLDIGAACGQVRLINPALLCHVISNSNVTVVTAHVLLYSTTDSQPFVLTDLTLVFLLQ
jgi:hypothetical protein